MLHNVESHVTYKILHILMSHCEQEVQNKF